MPKRSVTLLRNTHQGALFATEPTPVIEHDNVRGPDYYH